jgi:hypothetical protein
MLWHRKDLIDYFYVLSEPLRYQVCVCSFGSSKIICSVFFQAKSLNCVIVWNCHLVLKLDCVIQVCMLNLISK